MKRTTKWTLIAVVALATVAVFAVTTPVLKYDRYLIRCKALYINGVQATASGIAAMAAGANGTAGTFTIWPATGNKGETTITAADNSGNTITSIVTAAQAGARTYTVPDVGVSTSFVMAPGTGYVQTGIECLLSSTASVNVGAIAATALYTVPAGKTCLITRVMVRNASGTFNQLASPVASFGWNGTTFNDVIASATYTNPMAAATNYFILVPDGKTASTVSAAGAAAGVFKINVTTAATAATTCTIDVFGYLF